MKLISPDVLGDVRVIRRIRNEMAHPNLDTPPNFQNPTVELLIRKLKFGTYMQECNAQSDRDRFMWVWSGIASALSVIVGTGRPLDLHRMVVNMSAPTAKGLYSDDV